jgi:hypothetical protein
MDQRHPGRIMQTEPDQPVTTQIDELLAANAGYAHAAHPYDIDARPRRRLAVLTCMDARIDVFAVLGLHLGEAQVIRNGGGRVTNDVLRSLTLSCHVLGVDTVVLFVSTLLQPVRNIAQHILSVFENRGFRLSSKPFDRYGNFYR